MQCTHALPVRRALLPALPAHHTDTRTCLETPRSPQGLSVPHAGIEPGCKYTAFVVRGVWTPFKACCWNALENFAGGDRLLGLPAYGPHDAPHGHGGVGFPVRFGSQAVLQCESPAAPPGIMRTFRAWWSHWRGQTPPLHEPCLARGSSCTAEHGTGHAAGTLGRGTIQALSPRASPKHRRPDHNVALDAVNAAN